MTRIVLILFLTLFSTELFAVEHEVNRFSFKDTPCAVPGGIEGNYLKGIASYPINIEGSQSWSIGFWVKVDEYPEGHFGKWDRVSPMTIFVLEPADRAGASLFVRILKNNLLLTFFRTSSHSDEALNYNLRGISALSPGRWYHVMICHDATGKTVVYVNGIPDSFGKIEEGLPVWENMLLGSDGSKRALCGGVDEVSIYDTSLDAGAVRGLYQKKIPSRIKAQTGKVPSENKSEVLYGRYPSLQVRPEVLHPLIDQLNISATTVAWYGSSAQDLLIRGRRKCFGSRLDVHRFLGLHNGMPVYDEGTTITNLAGNYFQSVSRKDGLFDLYAQGEGTAYGNDCLVHYKNIGTHNAPEFAAPRPVTLNGMFFLKNALGSKYTGWCIKDIDGDQIPDFLVNVTLPVAENNWPFEGSPWSGKKQKNAGKGKGYDVTGQWLGRPAISELRWAKGVFDAGGDLNFRDLKEVHYLHSDNTLRMVGYGAGRAVNTIVLDGELDLLLSGDVDRIVCMPLRFDNGEIICGQSENFLKSGPSMESAYYPAKLMVTDMDGDGCPEVLIDGNPGTVAVLKGQHAGEFSDMGPVLTRGGPMAGETLVSPCRLDWDGDGSKDILLGDASGLLQFWPGTENPLVYGTPGYMTSEGKRIHIQAGLSGSIQGPTERRWGYLKVTAGDWDGDARPEIITCGIKGRLVLYQSGQQPLELEMPREFTLNGKLFRIAWRSRPALIDRTLKILDQDMTALLIVDWDGDAAVAIPSVSGGTDLKDVIKLKYENGKNMPMCGPCGLWGRAAMTVCDWDRDGRWDILTGSNSSCNKFIFGDKNENSEASPIFIRNIGSNSHPVFAAPVFITLKTGKKIEMGGHNATVWPSDLNGDGYDDLLVGAEDGKVYYFFRDQLEW